MGLWILLSFEMKNPLFLVGSFGVLWLLGLLHFFCKYNRGRFYFQEITESILLPNRLVGEREAMGGGGFAAPGAT